MAVPNPASAPTPAAHTGWNKEVLFVCLLVVLGTVAAYSPVWRSGFINFDDPDYVSGNPRVQSGLNAESIRWAFTAFYSSNWHPMTWLSHMLDSQIYGLKPAGHHVTSLILHAVNSLLVFGLFLRMTGGIRRSGMVAALFALHPLHVESVAWISERKDVLCAFFGLLSLWAYVEYAKVGNKSSRSIIWYLAALFLFALGLMSKPMLVTLPCLLLLLDYWPLRRFPFSPVDSGLAAGSRTAGVLRLVLEKIPFLLLSAASSVLTFVVQKECGAMVPLGTTPLETRLANACVAYGTYLAKTFWPVKLAVFYPLTRWDFSAPEALGALLVILAITGGAIFVARKRPYLIIGWLWFLGTLVPVIGVVQVGRQSMADRYMYLPQIGLFLMVVWGAADAARHFRIPRAADLGLAALVLGALGVATSQQVSYWRNNTTLFEHALEVTTGNYVAYGVLGNALIEQGKLQEAIEMCEKSIALAPEYPEAYNTLGNIRFRQELYDQAIENYRLAAKFDPNYADPLAGMGHSYLKLGRLPDAEAQCRAALQLAPLHLSAMFGLASALHNQGKLDEAADWYRRILALQPGLFSPRRLLGNVLVTQGKPDEAIQQFQLALKTHPDDPDTHVALGVALMQKSQVDAAAAQFLEGLKQQPANAIANYQLGTILEGRKDFVASAGYYRQALLAQSNWPEVLNNLAWLLATCPNPAVRNGTEAVEQAERACKLTSYKVPLFIGTLAAAYAEAGRFSDATQAAKKARDLALAAGLKEVAEKNSQLLELYRAGKAYHEPE